MDEKFFTIGSNVASSTYTEYYSYAKWWTVTVLTDTLGDGYRIRLLSQNYNNYVWRDYTGRCSSLWGTDGYGNDGYNLEKYDPISLKQREIKSQLTIIVKSRAQTLDIIPDNEWVAMQTLREMITETEYRKYIKDGFITVRGKSGKVYQIFRNRSHTKVYFQGELIEEICVRLQGLVPPTDSVIAFKTMIEADEESFAILGNRYNMKRVA
jgi:hypothetical protein